MHLFVWEGASAWGVWLRVDNWPTAVGKHPRLRCGVLYHVANRTLSFHGVGWDAVQFLVPLFELKKLKLGCRSLTPIGLERVFQRSHPSSGFTAGRKDVIIATKGVLKQHTTLEVHIRQK